MKIKTSAGLVMVCAILCAVSLCGCPWKPTLTIHWAQWAPADFLDELSADFTEETGIEVEVVQTSWDTFVDDYTAGLDAHTDAWDIVVGDSQDIGAMATGGHYVDLTTWIQENGVAQDFTETSMRGYAEYPKGSGKYYAVPCEGDALGWAYRKDLFEDPARMAAFQTRYGYPLSVPTSWDAIRDIAEFFHDPANGFYGAAIYGENGYDSLCMFGEQVIWAFGGELGDFNTYQVDGLLNSPGAVAGLEYYRALFQFTPPNFDKAFAAEVNAAFVAGKVPMACNYFAFFPELADATTNPHAAVTGYFACPPQVGADGKTRQFASLGGQGASISAYSKHKDAAYQWLEWFIQPETQAEWARLGGGPCHKATLASDTFLNAKPYNPAFRDSMAIAKDWWSCPEYRDLLSSFKYTVGPYVIDGEQSAKAVLDACTATWEWIFWQAGYYDVQ